MTKLKLKFVSFQFNLRTGIHWNISPVSSTCELSSCNVITRPRGQWFTKVHVVIKLSPTTCCH